MRTCRHHDGTAPRRILGRPLFQPRVGRRDGAAEDWEHHRRYDDWFQAYEEMFEHTETEWAPWTIVEATDRRFTQVKIFQTIIHTLEERLGVVYEPPPELTEQREAASTVELQAGPASLDGASSMLEESGQTP